VKAWPPPEDVPEIEANHVLPLGAKTFWRQQPNASAEARRIATEHGLAFVEGSDIAAVARSIRAARK